MEREVGISSKCVENEIDLIDLLKILFNGKKVLLITWLLTVVCGLFVGIYLKNNEKMQAIRKFQIEKVTDGIEPLDFFENHEFVDSFFDEELIKKIEGIDKVDTPLLKRNFIKNLFKVEVINNGYSLVVKGDKMSTLKNMEKIYFNHLAKNIEKISYDKINKKLAIAKEETEINKEKLNEIEKKISMLPQLSSKTLVIMDLRDIYPSLFAEKDAIDSLYRSNFTLQKDLELKLKYLKDSVTMISSLNTVENKLSISFVFIISNILGIFLGVFLIFLMEFLKTIEWEKIRR